MNKQLLLEKYIKLAVRKSLQEEEQLHKQAERSIYLIYKFPGLKKTVEELMSPAFSRYITNVTLIAPKPTTFKFKLVNDQDFLIKYLGNKNFSIKISGKKYNPVNLGELERASQALADLLELNYNTINDKEAAIQSAENAKNKDLKGTLENPGAPLPAAATVPPSGETPPEGENPAITATNTPEETPPEGEENQT
jgi:hypothetical protein